MNTKSTKNHGFTLIEILVVISIFGLLSSIILVSLNNARDQANIAAGQQFNGQLYHAYGADDAYMLLDFSSYVNGCQLVDSSFNNYYVTAPGCPVTKPPLVPSINGNGIQLNNSSYVQAGGANGTILGVSSPFSASFWIKVVSFGSGSTRTVMAHYGGSGGFRFIFGNSTKLVVQKYWGATGNLGITSPNSFSTDKYYHVAVSVDELNNKAVLFINGRAVKYQEVSPLSYSTPTGTPTLSLGDNGDPAQNIILDDVRIYKKAMTASEIQKLYAEGASKHLADAK